MKKNKKARSDAASSEQAKEFEECNHLLDNFITLQGPVSSALPVGRENALSPKFLCALLGYSNTRSLRKQIELERRAGAVICFDGEAGGYFLPATVEDVRNFIRTMEARTRTTNRCIRAAKKLLREVEKDEG